MEIIDVTIRESVYLKNGMTEEKAIAYLSKYCELMPFEEVRGIEICFLDNTKQGALLYNEKYIRTCYNLTKGKYELVAVIHPHLVDLRSWNPEIIKMFSIVRLMINDYIDTHTEQIIEYLHGMGIKVSLNVIYITRKDEHFVGKCLEVAQKCNVERFCLADSCGGLSPDRASYWANYIHGKNHSIALNFHFHDHFNLALANAIACVNCVDILDASVWGLGKGGGNLNLEDIIYIVRKNNGVAILQDQIIKYAELLCFLLKDILNTDWQQALDDYKNMLIAFYDCTLNEVSSFEKVAQNDALKFIRLISDGR